jgi:hypothetical protein
MTQKQKESYLSKYWLTKKNYELAEHLGIGDSTLRRWARKMGLPQKPSGGDNMTPKNITPEEMIEKDREAKKSKTQTKTKEKAYDVLLSKYETVLKENEILAQVNKDLDIPEIEYKPLTNDTESVAVVLASDFHIEERVDPETVHGLNKYNMRIAEERSKQFFQNTLKLVEKERQATRIDTLILALLGDFISNTIHEELLQINEVEPAIAMIKAEQQLVSGIQYLLDNSDLKLIIPCHSGNHGRMTKKTHIGNEAGNSLEYFMYHHIASHFEGNERVQFIVPKSYHSYVDVFGYTICFSHGHAVKYGGGVGGITIPLKKAIGEWRKMKHADLFCMGHFHQFIDVGDAIVNGSLIGYNPFAIFIKAAYETPKQTFFLINKKYKAKTVVCPILFSI